MNGREFGQLVKKRFPQYSELSDERVAALALKKFPQYHDIVKPDDIPQYAITPQQQPVTPPQTNTQQPEFMKMSRREFAQATKKKYPQLSKWSDEDLTTYLLEKHPEYYDKVQVPAAIGPKDATIGPAPTGLSKVGSSLSSRGANYGSLYNLLNLPKLLDVYGAAYDAAPTGVQNFIDSASNSTLYDQARDDGLLENWESRRETAYNKVIAAGGTEEEAVKAYENAVTMMDYAKAGMGQMLRGIASPLNLALAHAGVGAAAIGGKVAAAFTAALTIDDLNDVREVGGALLGEIRAGNWNGVIELLPQAGLVIGDIFGTAASVAPAWRNSIIRLDRGRRLNKLKRLRAITQQERAEAAAVAAAAEAQTREDGIAQIQEGLARTQLALPPAPPYSMPDVTNGVTPEGIVAGDLNAEAARYSITESEITARRAEEEAAHQAARQAELDAKANELVQLTNQMMRQAADGILPNQDSVRTLANVHRDLVKLTKQQLSPAPLTGYSGVRTRETFNPEGEFTISPDITPSEARTLLELAPVTQAASRLMHSNADTLVPAFPADIDERLLTPEYREQQALDMVSGMIDAPQLSPEDIVAAKAPIVAALEDVSLGLGYDMASIHDPERVRLANADAGELMRAYANYHARETGTAPEEFLNSIRINYNANAGGGSARGGTTYDQKAYHGSPFRFDRFSTDKIGTGEGAQAHGWGMYFAKNRDTAERYRKQLIGQFTVNGKETYVDQGSDAHSMYKFAAEGRLQEYIDDVTRIADEYAAKSASKNDDWYDKLQKKYRNNAEEAKKLIGKDVKHSTGQLYEAEIPDDGEMLDEAKPFSEQPPAVRNALLQAERNGLLDGMQYTQGVLRGEKGPDGGGIYDAVMRDFEAADDEEYRKNYNPNSRIVANGALFDDIPKRASEFLRELGIKGIAYNGGQDGPSAVVFDDASVNILDTLYQTTGGGMTAEQQLQHDEAAFSQAVDEFVAGKKFTRPIRIMNTPLVMKLAGAKVLPVEIPPSVLQKVLAGKHSGQMTPEILKQVPHALTDPMMIFDSKTSPGRSVVLLALKDADGVNIVVPFELNATGATGAYQMNLITSVYGRGRSASNGERVTDARWIARQVSDGRLRYINKKATASEFSQLALQLRPGELITVANTQNVPDETDLVNLKNENTGFYKQNRGSVTFRDGIRYVDLFKSANESTLIHEAGHIFLEDLQNLSNRDGASAAVRSDWGAVREYLGVADGQRGLTREQHERFADSFTEYIHEGKAPTERLREVFERLRQWLTQLFQRSGELGIELTPEIRRVFDNLLSAGNISAAGRSNPVAAEIASSISHLAPSTRQMVDDTVKTRMSQIEQDFSSELGELSGRRKIIKDAGGMNYGALERGDENFGKIRVKSLAPELNDLPESPGRIAEAIRRDKNNALELRVKERVQRDTLARYADEIEMAEERAAIQTESQPSSETVGGITPEVAAKIGLRPGAITLNESALQHIEQAHGKQIHQAGFADAREFVNYVLSNVDAVYQGNTSRTFDFVAERDSALNKRVLAKIEFEIKGNRYEVKTAGPIRTSYYEEKAPLWEGARPSSQIETPSAARRASQRGQSGDVPPLLGRAHTPTSKKAPSATRRASQRGKSGERLNFTAPVREVNLPESQENITGEEGFAAPDLLGINKAAQKIRQVGNFAKQGGDAVKLIGYYSRPAGNVLKRSGDAVAKQIAEWINRAERRKIKALISYRNIAKDIIRDNGIVRNTIEDQALIQLLDSAQTGLTPSTIKDAFNLSDRQAARVISAASAFRRKFFDPLINSINDPTWKTVTGRSGKGNIYVEGYFPHMFSLLEKMEAEGAGGAARQYLGRSLTSRYLNHRTGTPFDTTGISIYDVIDPYAKSMLRTIHDLPNVRLAKERLPDIKDEDLRTLADKYIRNYTGESRGINKWLDEPGKLARAAREFSRGLAQMYYNNLIGFSPSTWFINLTQTMVNTWPEIGATHLSVGLYKMLDPKERAKLREEGVWESDNMFDTQTLGALSNVMHIGMKYGEQFNRGVAYLGGLSKGRAERLTGEDLNNYARDIVDRTQFNYGHAGDIMGTQALSPDLRTFKQYWMKESNFIGESAVDFIDALGNIMDNPKAVTRADRAQLAKVGRMAVAWYIMYAVFGERMLDLITRGIGFGGGFLGRTGDLVIRLWGSIEGALSGEKSFEEIGRDFANGFFNVAPAGRTIKNIWKEDDKVDGIIKAILPFDWAALDDDTPSKRKTPARRKPQQRKPQQRKPERRTPGN